jgi:hypothetical protein
LSKIVDRALETIADRLENGNVKYDFKKQEAFREPVSIKDATSAAKALMDQQMQMEKLKVVETSAQATISVQDQIKMLAQEFAKFNTKRTISLEPPAEDVQFTDNGVSSEGDNDNAIHEEREEGLQEGSSSLYLETGSSEEEDGAERSTSDDGEGRTGT